MARIAPFLLIAILLLTALAGCLGGGDDPDPSDDADGGDTGPTGTHGVVKGRLVTLDDLEPVRGGMVRLILGTELVAEKTTGANGDYIFSNVEPGTYRLQVTTICCREQVRTVTVKAGETTQESFTLERLAVPIIRDAYVDTDGEWEGFINCGVTTTQTGVLYPAACQQGDHSVRKIEFLPPGVRTMTLQLSWDSAGSGLGADKMRLSVHNLNAKFELIGEVEGASPLTLQIQNLDLPEDKRFHDFDDAGWVGRFAVTPLSDGASVLYQQRFNLQYHVHYWEQGPATYDISTASTGGSGEGLSAKDILRQRLALAQQQNEEGPNDPQGGPNSACLDFNVIYMVDGHHSPLAVIVEVEADTGYVIDSSMGVGFVDFHDANGDYLTWSAGRHWGNVPEEATYALLCVGMTGGWPDAPEVFATWFYMDGFPKFE